ncbi:MAG: NFACT family protein [Anaerolineae bacterium]|nr:NFACT family protein [Anaerolineae bacterium]
MYFDALTAAAVADECQVLVGGRIQTIVQIDELTLGFEIYAQHQRHYLVTSAHAQHARVHLCGDKLRRGVDTPSPILLLLRKYAQNARISLIDQPAWERIVEIEIENDASTYTLIAEVMGRHANLILVDEEGRVMDAIKRVTPQMSRVRPILPGRPYSPPPQQAKLDPTALTLADLRDVVGDAAPGDMLWRVLVGTVRGISPLLAREVIYRASGNAQTNASQITDPAVLLSALERLLSGALEHRWTPCLAVEEDIIAAYAPYALTHYPEYRPASSISAAIESYEAGLNDIDAYKPARARVRPLLEEARQRVQDRYDALRRQMVPEDEIERLRLSGEMILAYAHTVERRQTRLEAPVDFERPPLQIDLDPHLTPVENAQAYFKRYDKARAANAGAPRRLTQARLELAYLDQLITDLELAANWPEIQEVQSALTDAGYASGPRRNIQRGRPLRVVSEAGFVIWVGKSARQNEEITFRRAAPDDLWLHAIDVPGSHVIVKCEGRPAPEETLRRSAELAAYYSAGREKGSVLVACTLRKWVRKIRQGKPGQVTYRNEQTILVKPRP